MRKAMVLASCIAALSVTACATAPLDKAAREFRLELFDARIVGKQVSLNGYTNFDTCPVWDWGDGSPREEHCFPNSHQYKEPGTYIVRISSQQLTEFGVVEKKAAYRIHAR